MRRPSKDKITPVGANTETDKQLIYKIYKNLLKDIVAKPGMTKTETYEQWAKTLFVKEPANMKLLVVVDKLLTGFDAPHCTYLYMATVALVRAYANMADELEEAGYSGEEIARIKQQLDQALKLRELIRQASGETLDLKPFEADMRHLIDTYIEADDPRRISPFENLGLLDLIVKSGIAEAIATRLGCMQGNKNAIAETIENNVRSTIIKEHLTDPAFYANISAQLQEIIAQRKAKAIAYEEYLQKIAELTKQVAAGQAKDNPAALDTPGKRALFNNLKSIAASPLGALPAADDQGAYAPAAVALDLALKIDAVVKRVRPDGWRGVQARETPREVLERESHDLWGRRYLLSLVEEEAAPTVTNHPGSLVLRVRPGTSQAQREVVMAGWYRRQVRDAAAELIETWECILGVRVHRLFVQRMKTRWGSCSPETRTIRLNTELAKKPVQCLEYILVHELMHLLERHHNARFVELMDRSLPRWRQSRELLNGLPLTHEEWHY
ncbi:YgjP-like metallopeptidase domain-containing protein [Thiocapsa sp. UBA6158]|uniref:YgjP-like metallopeptidase domain-containing protein n=1 Tax=Thiocapsa sp. UBA6158 TaxID=1947692 RepID=UPI0025F0060F|nr:YgjP-like metallopeptidase domain-containing protein [Thiocapsa sp. UBA6158]